MFEEQVTIQNPTGFHARPAALLAQFCKDFSEAIMIQYNDTEINPKSIISILAAGLKQGMTVTVQVSGANADEVGMQVVNYIENLKE